MLTLTVPVTDTPRNEAVTLREVRDGEIEIEGRSPGWVDPLADGRVIV
jgi:hypothetical protein